MSMGEYVERIKPVGIYWSRRKEVDQMATSEGNIDYCALTDDYVPW